MKQPMLLAALALFRLTRKKQPESGSSQSNCESCGSEAVDFTGYCFKCFNLLSIDDSDTMVIDITHDPTVYFKDCTTNKEKLKAAINVLARQRAESRKMRQWAADKSRENRQLNKLIGALESEYEKRGHEIERLKCEISQRCTSDHE